MVTQTPSVNFTQDAKIVQNLDPSKVNSHEKVSIHMFKTFVFLIVKPLEMIFNH